MNFLNRIKRKFDHTLDSKERSFEFKSRCNKNKSDLKSDLSAAPKQNNTLQDSLDDKNTKDSIIDALQKNISNLEKEIKKKAEVLEKEKSFYTELNNKYLHLQEEYELLVGRSCNNVSKLINFCELLKTMGISSVDDCIAIIRNEIVQSTSEMGFDIVDSYDGVFNPKIHTIVDTQFTNDSNLNNHIAKVVRPGIWYDNKCIIHQDVIVYTIN